MRELLESWLIALESERKSVHTIRSYRDGVTQFVTWCEHQGLAADLASPEPARLWLVSLARAGRGGGTMQTRLAALRAFASWLVEEGELSDAGVMRAEWPQADETAPPALTPAERDKILAQCDGKSFPEIRDAAMFSLMFDSLLRADELLSLTVDDVDLRIRRVRVRRGKGGRERWSAFSVQTARRLDRYARTRRRQPYAALGAYWLAHGRGGLTYDGLYAALKRRGAAVGIKVHPHMLRAGGAINWRRKGGSTESLMTIAGWRDAAMVMRYTHAAETELALEEAQRLFAE